MTPIERLLRDQIALGGPVSVAEYMRLCLGHPEYGYYIRRDPLGQGGDFTTAPEISQMFGEMVGLWLASVWRQLDLDGPRLVELGPGRGTLMADALRALRSFGMEPSDVWFVETSPALRAQQHARVPGAQWAEMLEGVPDGPALILANEFFDALPVRQYLHSPEGWRERRVGVIDDRLAWGLSQPLPMTPEAESWCEHSAEADTIARQIAGRMGAHGGAALLIDYGYRQADRPSGPTLQALRNQRPADPLEQPGEADLTWLIDFDWLAAQFPDTQCHHAEQGAFLAGLGMGARAAALAKAQPDQAGAIADALERLTSPAQMGTLFKVLAVTPPGPPPPGF